MNAWNIGIILKSVNKPSTIRADRFKELKYNEILQWISDLALHWYITRWVTMRYTVAALHQCAPGQMTWLEEPPPWLRPGYCFASVIVWRESKKWKMLPNLAISMISFLLFVCEEWNNHLWQLFLYLLYLLTWSLWFLICFSWSHFRQVHSTIASIVNLISCAQAYSWYCMPTCSWTIA